MVAGVVYILLAGQNTSNSSNGEYPKRHGYSYEPNAINFQNNYNSLNRNNRPDDTSRRNEPHSPILNIPSHYDPQQNTQTDYTTFGAPTTIRLPTTIRSPTTLRPISSSLSSFSISTTTTNAVSTNTPSVKVLSSTIRPTFEKPVTEKSAVKNVRIYANSSPRRKLSQPAPKHTTFLLPTADDLEENAVEREKLLFPSKETFENFGFTSGHQNSFGIPIEEDERILRMLNHQLASQNNEPKLKQNDEFFLLSITTDANVHQTKVSPTLPNIKKIFSSTERIRPINVTTDDGNFYTISEAYV